MTNQYSFEFNKQSYLIKRLFHPELSLMYHVHFFWQFKNLILRMMRVNGKWAFLDTMNIPFRFEDLEFHLAVELDDNEKRIANESNS